MSFIEPVSRPQDLSRGVRGTAGRPLADVLVRRPEPLLSTEANQMIDSMPWATVSESKSKRTSEVDTAELVKLAQRIALSPTRPGLEALAWLAWSCREEARKQYPDEPGPSIAMAKAFEEQCKASTDWLDRQETARAELEKTLKEAQAKTFAAGYAAGAAEVRKQLPSVVRETTFIEDERGHVVGKEEREFRT